MIYPHGKLTPDQIRTTYFVVPNLAIEFLYGPDGFTAFAVRRKLICDTGGDLLLIGWPDGTTVEYSRPAAHRPLDVEDLASMYRHFHLLRSQHQAQGEQS